MIPIRAALLLSLLASPAVSVEGPAMIQGVASVVDGDTLEIHGARIRLHGIDAPESGQLCTDAQGQPWRCGQRAAMTLADHIGGATVFCAPTDTDRYGRTVADCTAGGESLGRWMVRGGWALAYLRYSTDYAADEAQAKADGLGLWSGGFDAPWDWRQARRGVEPAPVQRLMQLSAQNYSCSGRKTCKAIGSCEEAVWYLENCSWGGRLDRDGDGVPCESLC